MNLKSNDTFFIEFINEFNHFLKNSLVLKNKSNHWKKNIIEENWYTMSHDFTIYPMHTQLFKKKYSLNK